MTLGFFLALLAVAASAGFVGSLVGLGGGIVVIPALTLLFGVDMHYAAGAGLVTVIATSSGGAIRYLRQGLCNIRVGVFLELATTFGALGGALLAGVLTGPSLQLIFGVVVLGASVMVLRRQEEHGISLEGDRLSCLLRLEDEYLDHRHATLIEYHPQRTVLGFLLMIVAGVLSGLLGIGSGVFKVPAMDTAMGLPIKVSAATSNFMMGVTASSGAAVYFARGDINPVIAGPVAIGVLLGARLGSRLLPRLPAVAVRRLFVAVLVIVAVRMMLEGLGV